MKSRITRDMLLNMRSTQVPSKRKWIEDDNEAVEDQDGESVTTYQYQVTVIFLVEAEDEDSAVIMVDNLIPSSMRGEIVSAEVVR